MTIPPEDFATQAAAERERAVTQDLIGHHWHGAKLQPWTARREILFLALRRMIHEGPLAPVLNKIHHLPLVESRIQEHLKSEAESNGAITVDSLIDWPRFQPDTAIVLWLAMHREREINDHTADFNAWLQEIISGAEETIPPDELIPAVRLAHTLRTAHQQLITLPRPDAASRKRDAGN